MSVRGHGAGGRVLAPGGPARCNCFLWAVSRWMRRGGYVAFRTSRHFRALPHFVWSSNARVWWGYEPLEPKDGIGALCHGLWFRGQVKLERP